MARANAVIAKHPPFTTARTALCIWLRGHRNVIHTEAAMHGAWVEKR